MVSFGLAFGKGAVTALRQKQERKWEKEAYEESPEFELAGLQIKQAKENLATEFFVVLIFFIQYILHQLVYICCTFLLE